MVVSVFVAAVGALQPPASAGPTTKYRTGKRVIVTENRP
jgi:hypothetical protein